MNGKIRTLAAFFAAVFAAYLVASIISTQMILHQVARFELPIPFDVRLDTTLHDLMGMMQMYLPLVAASLLIGFPVSALARRFVPIPRWLGYTIAGGAALWALHLIMFALFDIHALPVTRTALGMAGQVLAGLVGGLVFARLSDFVK